MNKLAQRSFCVSGTLLPYNATKFERDVESAIKYEIDAGGLAGFKFSDYGNLRLSLIWEYSLAQVNIDDLKTKITEGLKFHRLAGTPYSLRQVLSWYNLKDITIEEEEPGEHFAEFQVGFKEIPDGFAINTIINVAEMAKPLRSRLTRMYNEDYDIRRFILDSSDWGDLLSDHSGTQIYEDSPKLSFGRKMFCDAKLDTYNTLACKQTTRVTFAKFEDIFKLDFGRLDDTKFGEPTEKNFYLAKKQTQNTDRVGDKIPDQLIKLRTFSRAMIVLSESVLEDGQSCFSGNYEEANDETFLLDFSYLSETPCNPCNVIIDKRLFEEKTADGECDLQLAIEKTDHKGHGVFESSLKPKIIRNDTAQQYVAVKYRGNNTWHDHRHFNVAWNKQNFFSVMN